MVPNGPNIPLHEFEGRCKCNKADVTDIFDGIPYNMLITLSTPQIGFQGAVALFCVNSRIRRLETCQGRPYL